MTKKQPTRTAYFNLHTLIGLAGVGIVLTALVVYAAGRTSTNKPPKQQLPSGPAPQGSVTEAWVRRINGPLTEAIMGMTLQQMRQATFMLPDGLKPRQPMKIPIP
jgi:hypothetical protein